MPTYNWKCAKCNTVTEIFRPVKDYEIPPDDGCPKCGGKELQRTIEAKTFILKDGGVGWHDTNYTKYRSIK